MRELTQATPAVGCRCNHDGSTLAATITRWVIITVLLVIVGFATWVVIWDLSGPHYYSPQEFVDYHACVSLTHTHCSM